MGLKNSKVLGI